MDQKDEFSKWMKSVEEALSNESAQVDEDLLEQGACGGCGAWNCPECFPDQDGDLSALSGQQIPAVIVIGTQPTSPEVTPASQEPMQQTGIGMAGTHPVDGDTFDHDTEDELDVTMMGDVAFDEEDSGVDLETDTMPRSGKGVKLGHIVQKFVKADSEGNESPLTYGEDNLDEDNLGGETSEIIGKIMYMQDMGLSKDNKHYSEEDLAMLPPEKLSAIQQSVVGGMAEEHKPTKTKTTHPLDDMDDVLNPRKDEPLMPYGHDDEEPAAKSMDLPTASAAQTQQKVAGMNPSDMMRDLMNRIDKSAGGDEPELANTPQDTSNALVAQSAQDVPAVISTAMQATGEQSPVWHTINNLPGYSQQNVRGMGRQIFSMFTSTPLEQIKTVANVDGQGPNTDEEMRAVANWLMHNADDLGKVELSHGKAIPGYKPEVKEYSANGIRFHCVQDPMGQYIYAYPEADARLPNNTQQGALPAGNTPQLRESALILTITESIKLDDIIRESLDEIELTESSLSKLIGKQQGGQRLVQWLHRKHKLSNEADLQPQPFSERMMWKEFKRNPDNFVVVSATNGVAGIKPYEKQIKDRMALAQKKGKEYDPGGDSTLQYQIIAFTDDGKQVDPALLQPAPVPGEEREEDPTVMKARMGKISGKDMQNPDNVFNLLADQIGTLKTVYVVSGGVERDKLGQRDQMKKADADLSQEEGINAVFKMVRPVLKKLAAEAMSPLLRARQRAVDNDNDEELEKLTRRIKKIKEFLVTIDTTRDVDVGSSPFGESIRRALGTAAGSGPYTPRYAQYLSAAAKGSRAALKPVLDALRDDFFAKM